MDDHVVSAVGEIVCNVRGVQEIVGKVFLDDVLLVACADKEFFEAIVSYTVL